MINIVKKFNEFLLENKTYTETDIREFVKNKLNEFKNSFYTNLSTNFPLDTLNKLDSKKEEQIDLLLSELSEIWINYVIDNISDFNKTWKLPNNDFNLYDKVKDKKTGEIFVISKFGSDNNFYDENKKIFKNISEVEKM